MFHDEIFEKALRDVKEESYRALKEEIATMEAKIEHFLDCFFESSAFRSERDFNASAI